MLVAQDRRLMGNHAARGDLRAAGWFVVVMVSTVSIVYLVQQVAGGG
ncbi:MAG TPA: hypothetical protein VET24_03740 [Actinomycetota bacterium]|nr:hypothetical protein [Actinomycetota bacterium]